MAPIAIAAAAHFSSSAANAWTNLAARLPAAEPPAYHLAARDPDVNPTPTLSSPPQNLISRLLHARQSVQSIIPLGYGAQNTSLPPGTIVGIVIGSVAGFLLLLWLIYTCLNFGTGAGWGGSTYTESVVVRERDRRKSRHGSSHRGSHRSRRAASETIEIQRSESRAPPPRPPSPARIIVEERREEIRRVPSRRESDEVVVIEEHSPPRRKKSRRPSSHRSERVEEVIVDSGFRTVDPLAYGGVVGGNSRRPSRRRE